MNKKWSNIGHKILWKGESEANCVWFTIYSRMNDNWNCWTDIFRLTDDLNICHMGMMHRHDFDSSCYRIESSSHRMLLPVLRQRFPCCLRSSNFHFDKRIYELMDTSRLNIRLCTGFRRRRQRWRWNFRFLRMKIFKNY